DAVDPLPGSSGRRARRRFLRAPEARQLTNRSSFCRRRVKVYYGDLFFKEVRMTSRAILAPVAVVFVLAISPAFMWAQNAGFGIGVAPPPVGFQPPQAPAVAMRGTFTMIPSFPLPVPQAPILPVPLIPNFPTVIVPNPVIVNPGPVILVPP